MKILHVIPSLAPETGGPAKAVLEVSEALAGAGHEVTIFSTDHGYESGTNGRMIRGEKVKIEFFKRKWPKGYFYSPDLKKALEQSVSAFDLVHIHGLWLYPTSAACAISRQQKVPYLLRPCGMLDQYSLSHHPFRKKVYALLVEGKNLRAAHTIHFTSQEEKDHSQEIKLPSRQVILPLGIKAEEYLNLPPQGQFRESNPFLKGKKIILFIGRINFKKGLDLLAEAVAELLQKGRRIHWIIAGSDNEGYGRRLRQMIGKKGIENNVTFTGFIEGQEKLSLLCDSDIFCLPSYQENFGFSVIEAMAAGLPVIVSDQVNIYSEIRSAQAGLVTSCKTKNIRAAIDRLLEDNDLGNTMGQNGRNLVLEKYDWHKNIKKIIELYENIARHY